MRISRPPPPPPAPPPHSRFGPYTLADRIAVGGMAEVFRAHEPKSAGEPRAVVVKRMLPSLATEPGARDMFEQEGKLGALIDHRNVVRVLGYGEEGGQPYLALEYVPGLDLWRFTRWLTREGRTLGTELAVFVVRELLAGLEVVHEACDGQGRALGLVHRDVSPSNVLLSIHGDVKLGDFGIAQARLRETFPQIPISERAKGKLGYLAPEQVRGQPADRRADVFSAAVIAAELLMGRPLFSGGSELAVLLAIRDAEVRPFVDCCASLPSGLGAAVLAALALDPKVRTPSARAFHLALAPFEVAPRSALAAELAGLVGEAQGSRWPSNTYLPAVRPGAPLHTLRAPGQQPEPGDPTTAEHPALVYFVKTSDGTTLGPTSYAKVVEGIATGRFGVTDLVAVHGGPFRPLTEHADLLRHLPASSFSEITLRRDTPGEPEREWSLDEGAIVSVLGRLALSGATGLLLCEQAGVRKEVYLRDGVPEFVTSNLASELLGEFLVARGVISRGELDMALAVMPRFEGRLGETLTALGLVEPVHLFRQIASQVEEKLLDLFVWNAGRATFWRGVARPPSGFPLGLDPFRVMLEGIDRRLARGFADRWLPGPAELVVKVSPPPEGLERITLPDPAPAILARLGSPVMADAIVAGFSDRRDPRSGVRALALLMSLGAVAPLRS